MEDFATMIARGIPDELPPMPPEELGINHAPPRRQVLTATQQELAVSNCLLRLQVNLNKPQEGPKREKPLRLHPRYMNCGF